MLIARIADLGEQIDALRPDWEVPTLKQSYLAAEVCEALLELD